MRGNGWLRAAGFVVAAVSWLFLVTLGHWLRHSLWPEEAADFAVAALFAVAATVWLSLATLLIIRLVPWLPRPGPRGVALVVLWMALLALGHGLSHTGTEDLTRFLEDTRDAFGGYGFVLFVLLYGLLLALPFFPGVEVGFAIMAMYGADGAIGCYLATVLGLSLAFGAGRLVPARFIDRLYERLDTPASDGDQPSSGEDRSIARLRRLLPGAIGAALVRYRYVTLALALNFPGSAAVGGGGGVSLLCGMSPLFDARWFRLTVAVATAPIPLLFIFGAIDPQDLMYYRGSLHDLLARMAPIFGLR